MSITINKPRQIDFQIKMWEIGINTVVCHTCPSVFFHETSEEKLVCPYCLAEGSKEFFSDLVHE